MLKRMLYSTFLLALAMLLAFSLVACGSGDDGGDDSAGDTPSCTHVDADDDGKCDKEGCGVDYSDGHNVHIDRDDDGICDVDGCEEPCTDGCDNHVDADDNGVCDVDGCEEPCADGCDNHVDADDNGVCDVDGCEEPCADGCDNHVDADDNGVCDVDGCEESFADGHDVHVDGNDDGACDVLACGIKFSDGCNNHRDADEDGICDVDGCEEPCNDGCDNHVDADDNGICDVDGCEKTFSDGHDVHVDGNDDHACDVLTCGIIFSDGCDNFVDTDGDGFCDNGNCGAPKLYPVTDPERLVDLLEKAGFYVTVDSKGYQGIDGINVRGTTINYAFEAIGLIYCDDPNDAKAVYESLLETDNDEIITGYYSNMVWQSTSNALYIAAGKTICGFEHTDPDHDGICDNSGCEVEIYFGFDKPADSPSVDPDEAERALRRAGYNVSQLNDVSSGYLFVLAYDTAGERSVQIIYFDNVADALSVYEESLADPSLSLTLGNYMNITWYGDDESIAISSGNVYCTSHVDADDDGRCDSWGCRISFDDGCDNHVDANDNGICDVDGCEEAYTDGCDNHVDNDENGICDTEGCDYVVDPALVCGGEDSPSGTHRDADDDWTCDYCGEDFQDDDDIMGGECVHRDADDNGLCDHCGTEFSDLPEPKTYNITWDTTNLIFQINECSNRGELTSTCRRYLAGDTTGIDDYSVVDTYVTRRNEAALEATGVSISYTYLPDDSAKYGWGCNIETIYSEVYGQSSNRPDIYCNFVYDMVATSLKGSFANLMSTSRGENFFEFLEDDFVDHGTDYMYTYMRSLTLNKFKMYCIASDFYIDTIRASYVVPVNVGLLGSEIDVDIDCFEDGYDPDAATGYNSDRNGDQDFTIDDFYDLVYDGQWNYETLAEFCADVYEPGSQANTTGNAHGCLHDTLGFAISCSSGLSASGMLYTTTVKVIHNDWDESENDYIYSYPTENNDLYNFAENMYNFFNNTDGAIAITNEEDLGYGLGDGALVAIREQFAKGQVLFGGIICLGSLEYDTYSEMEGGFGLAPAPLYRTVDPATGEPDKYQTQIHNIGRVGAISATTTKFTQCTAYLDYQSLNSGEVLDEYYNFKLQYDVAGSGDNITMLKYMRENIRSSFDKTFEDAIGRFFTSATDPDSNKWHKILMDNKFLLNGSGMLTEYNKLIGTKISYLERLQMEYDSLPD